MSMVGQGIKWRRNIAYNFNRLSRVHGYRVQGYRRQTDGRWHIANVNVSSLKKLILLHRLQVSYHTVTPCSIGAV